MQTLSQSVLSTEPVQVLVQATTPDGAYDPTGDAVSFAFTSATAYPQHPPSDDDWTDGTWVTYPNDQYWAQILVGPENGGVSLAVGLWAGWVMITDDPDVPVRQPFLLQIN